MVGANRVVVVGGLVAVGSRVGEGTLTEDT